MFSNMQNLIVFASVAVAAGYLALRAWRVVRGNRSGNCGSCGTGCGKSAAIDPAQQLVNLELGSAKRGDQSSPNA